MSEHISILSNADRAQVLVEALPYIQKYYGKIIVVKYGGNAMINEVLKHDVMRDMVLMSLIGVKVVLVHGGGPEISGMLKRVGKESQFVDGLRVTDEETSEIVQMVLAGKINKSLVAKLEMLGGRAMGISGMDGNLLKARIVDERLGYVGEIDKVDATPILDLLEKGYIPVVSTIGCDETGHVCNINADTAAAAIAGALKAEALISMTDTVGLLMDPNDPSTLIRRIDLKGCEELKEKGVISGGMIPKVACCTDAIRDGVRKVFIIDGRVPHALLIECLTDEGAGTMFKKELNPHYSVG
ncbi:MAG: acetylglutamate kinase [Clostridia bacterium]|nr:acetylglutamate kinase [Clostridia bacterium]